MDVRSNSKRERAKHGGRMGRETYFFGSLTTFRSQITTFRNIHYKVTFDCSIGATSLYIKEDQRLV